MCSSARRSHMHDGTAGAAHQRHAPAGKRASVICARCGAHKVDFPLLQAGRGVGGVAGGSQRRQRRRRHCCSMHAAPAAFPQA